MMAKLLFELDWVFNLFLIRCNWDNWNNHRVSHMLSDWGRLGISDIQIQVKRNQLKWCIKHIYWNVNSLSEEHLFPSFVDFSVLRAQNWVWHKISTQILVERKNIWMIIWYILFEQFYSLERCLSVLLTGG